MSPGATSFAGGELPPELRLRRIPVYRRSRLKLEIERLGNAPNSDPVAAMRDELLGEAQEVVLVVAINGIGNVADLVEIARGGYHSVVVPLPPLLAVPILAGCDRLMIAHTHPSGRLAPSEHDYDMTETVVKAVNACGMILTDSLIFGPDGQHLSLRETGVLEVPDPLPLEVQE